MDSCTECLFPSDFCTCPRGASAPSAARAALAMPLAASFMPSRPDPRRFAASRPDGREVEGVASFVEGPVLVPAPFDPWRWLAIALTALAVGPLTIGVLVALLAVRFAVGFALAMLHIGRRGGAGGALAVELVMLWLMRRLFGEPAQVPCYHYRVDTNRGVLGVRQVGELVVGRVAVRDRVRLHGRWRSGELQLEGGFNETTGARLIRRAHVWKLACVAAATIALAEWMTLADLLGHASPSAGWRPQ